MEQNRDSLIKTGAVLAVFIRVHQPPAVFLRGFVISQRRVVAGGAEEGFVGDDKAVCTVLDINGGAVHLLVDPDQEGTLGI